MQVSAAFGKRRQGPVPPPLPGALADEDAEDPPILAAPVQAEPIVPSLEWKGVPYLSIGIIAILITVFGLQHVFALDPARGQTQTLRTLVALGGVDGSLVFQWGQWWRIFTAPLLHASALHLIGNCVSLLFAGLVLERLIGRLWFGAVFTVSALGGSVGSLLANEPTTLSVGTSGAIMGLLAAAFVCSFLFEAGQMRLRMRKVSLRLLVPSFLSALLPLAGTTGGIDHGAHLGGAAMGALMGLLLREIWPETSPKPLFQQAAGAVAGAGTVLAAVAFLLVAQHYPFFAARSAMLIPERDLPRTTEEGTARSADLVQRFPRDPRAYLYRALYFLERQNAGDAERALRAGLAEEEILQTDLPADLERSLQLLLAVVLVSGGRMPEVQAVAQEGCRAADPTLEKIREMLQQRGVCT